MASQLLGIKTRFTNDVGQPLIGGQVYTFFAGTSTSQDTYSDALLTVPNTNPVILDDTGSADIFLKGSYRIRVFDKSGRFIEEQDNVTQAASQGDATELSNKVSAVEDGLSTANIEIDKVKLDTGITATAKFGGVERTQAAINSQSVAVEDFKLSTDLDDTQAFLKACALGLHVKATAKDYKIVGEIPLASGTTLEFTNNPNIEMDCSGDFGRGFYFAEGVHDAKIIGAANITAYATTLTTIVGDGSRQGVFTWGSDYYISTDRAKTYKCDVRGNFTVNVIGANNVKPWQVYGYVEDCYAGKITASGKANFAFVCHWVGNGTETTIPTKTWHPHNITLDACIADNKDGNLLRAFTFSACGRITLKDCQSIYATTLGLNLFIGDYGFQFAQNITADQAFDIVEYNTQVFSRAGSTPLSVDGLSSRKNNAPYWAGCDNNASVQLNGLKIIRDSSSSNLAFAVTGIKELKGSFTVIDNNSSNTSAVGYITSIENVDLSGTIKANGHIRYRDCNVVKQSIEYKPLVESLNATSQQLQLNGNSYDSLSVGSAALGATSITIDAITGVVGRGGFIRYNDGTKIYEIEMLSTTYSGGQQLIKTVPLPVAIPNGASLSIVSVPCKSANISGSFCSVRTPLVLNNSGSNVNARARDVLVTSKFSRSGLYDIDAQAVDGLNARIVSDYCGLTSTTVNTASVKPGDNAINWNIGGSKFGKGTNVRYIVWPTNTSHNGLVDNNIFESLNSNSASPACVFLSTANNLKVGTNQINTTGKPLSYP